MLIIKNNALSIEPIIDVINNNHLIEDLSEAINDYILSNKRKAVIAGEALEVFYVSGLADYHHKRLVDYLNSFIFNKYKLEARVVKGKFANYPTRHCWIMANNLLIDIAIQQFADKTIELCEIVKPILKSHCFICDNPENLLYRLYSVKI